MDLTKAEQAAVIDAANKISLTEPMIAVATFFENALGLSKTQVAELFVDSALEGADLISLLTRERENALRNNGYLPSFIVHKTPGVTSGYSISGLATYLATLSDLSNHPSDFLIRLEDHAAIRESLLEIDKGHHLELVAAALLEKACLSAEATMGSGDQGIDAIAWKSLIHIDDAFLDGELLNTLPRAGRNTVIIASSKASVSGVPADHKLALINPAHIRELVGGWLIQRSEVGAWRQAGIQMLTPLQLVLVTTYRLSEDAKAECRKLGIQVWGVPELIYLTCKFSPASVWPAVGTKPGFSKDEFSKWWKLKSDRKSV